MTFQFVKYYRNFRKKMEMFWNSVKMEMDNVIKSHYECLKIKGKSDDLDFDFDGDEEF